MGGFHEALLDHHAALLQRCQPHPFMVAVVDGSIPEERFANWLGDEHLWIRDFESFLAQLATRSPGRYQRAILETVLNAGGFREALEEMAKGRRIDLERSKPSFATHACIQFLLATVHVRSFEEAISACFAAHYAYLESWREATRNQSAPSPWQDFIDMRTTDSFIAWVEQLGRYVDQAAEDAPGRLRGDMMQAFGMCVHYYIRCWDAALDGSDPW